MRGRRGERKRASAFTGPGRVALRLFHPQREVVLHGPLPLRARGGARARCPSSLTTVRVRARLECVWGTWAVARFQFRHYRAGADSRTKAVFEALPAPLRVVLLSLARRMRAALPPCLHVYGLSCRLAGYGDNPCWPPDLGPDSGLAPFLARAPLLSRAHLAVAPQRPPVVSRVRQWRSGVGGVGRGAGPDAGRRVERRRRVLQACSQLQTGCCLADQGSL